MWYDTLHPSCSVQRILGRDVVVALGNARGLGNVLNSYGEFHVRDDGE